MDFSFLRTIRELELAQILPLLPADGRIVELGAGAGWQSFELAQRGYNVVAFDVPESEYVEERTFDVALYDGSHIPLPAHSVDVVFSSNVLEHVENLSTLLTETRRVLKPTGMAIHILPTPAWRFWNMITHQVGIAKEIAWRSLDVLVRSKSTPPASVRPHRNTRPLWQKLLRMILPPRHGAHGCTVTELFSFSKTSWKREFLAAGFECRSYFENELWYTGNYILGSNLPIPTRRMLSHLLGSSCQILVLSPSAEFAAKTP